MFSNLKYALQAVPHVAGAGGLSWRTRSRALLHLLREEAPPDGLRLGSRVLHFDLTHKPDWRVFRECFVKRAYATEYTDHVVIDIGAHRGLFSAFVLEEGCAAVLAYEPEPSNFAYLEKNLADFKRIGQKTTAYPFAVSSQQGTATFYVYDQSWSHSLLVRNDRTPVAELNVQQVDFESVISQAAALASGTRRILVKIDAEGIEYDILTKTPLSALMLIDELFVETHTYAEGSPQELAGHLARAGLRLSAPRREGKDEHSLLHFVSDS